MERSSKRKATNVSPAASETRVTKRQRTPSSRDGQASSTSANGKIVREVGSRFIQQLKQLCDKNGRVISTAFLTLPDPNELPGYYEQIVLPIAIDTIEVKFRPSGTIGLSWQRAHHTFYNAGNAQTLLTVRLEQNKIQYNEYTSLTEVESDAKRMVANAKVFNEAKSEIYADAERIRKMTSNFMTKANPAYKDPRYAAFPTPLPTVATEDETTAVKPHPIDRLEGDESRDYQPAATPAQQTRRSISAEKSADALKNTNNHVAGAQDEQGYSGKTFQQAQEHLIVEMINYKDASDLELFAPFVNLPPRTLTDYYSVIKNPLSLKGIQKKIRGFRSRNDVTGISDYKSWDALAVDVGRIADNAREYNEDGSDLHVLAGELEATFKRRLLDVKTKVDEPTQPTIKLKMASAPPPIKLKLGGTPKAAPPPDPVDEPSISANVLGTVGVTVDKAALQRQRELVVAGVNGHASIPNKLDQVDDRSTIPAGPPPQRAKSEDELAPTPLQIADSAIKYDSKPVAPSKKPSGNDTRLPESDVHPAATTATPLPSNTAVRDPGASPQPAHIAQTQTQTKTKTVPQPYFPHVTQVSGLETKWRQDGKGAADALIRRLELNTDPILAPQIPFQLNIPPDPLLSQTSLTLVLPPSHHYLHLAPKLAQELADGRRPYKLFITVNNQRVQQLVQTHLPIAPDERKGLLFQLKLQHGMNRVEVECVAAAITPMAHSHNQWTSKGAELEIEKATLYILITQQ